MIDLYKAPPFSRGKMTTIKENRFHMLQRVLAENPDADLFRPVSYDSFLKNSRTGDVLLALSRELSSIPTRIYSEMPWTHVGLVCRTRISGSKVMVTEFSGHNPTEEIYRIAPRSGRGMVLGDGVGLYDLDDFYMNNGGIYWRPLRLELESDEKKIADSIKTMLSCEPQRFCDISEILASSLFGTHFSGGVVCSTAVAIALYSANILKLDKKISSYIPCDFARDDIWNLTVPPPRPFCIVGYESKAIKIPPDILPSDFSASLPF